MGPELIFFAELVLALLVIAGIVAAGATDIRRTLRVLAGASAGLLVGGIFLVAVAGYRQFTLESRLDRISDEQRLMIFAALQLLVLGLGLAIGAWALASGQMARSGQWGWFIGLLLAALLIPLGGAALYSPRMLFGTSVSSSVTADGTLLGILYAPLVGILLLVAPLVALVYSFTDWQPAATAATRETEPGADNPPAPSRPAATRRVASRPSTGLIGAAERELRFQHSIWPIVTLATLQLLLGYQWLISGLDKILYGDFPTAMGQLLQQTLNNPRIPAFFASFLRAAVLPNTGLFGVLVEAGETLAGFALIGSGLVELIRPFADRHGGWLATALRVLERLLDVVAPLAAAGTLLMGLNYYFLDGAPSLLPIAGIAYGGAIDSGLLLALGSVVLLLGHFAHRRAIARARELDRQLAATEAEAVPLDAVPAARKPAVE
jgi:hypothetical protein